jgi:hypothetical protein
MKRTITIAMVALIIAGSAYLVIAADKGMAKGAKVEGKGEQVTITGQLSCTFCKLAHPDMVCKPDCCVACVKSGDPPMLTDAEGNMFLLVSGEKEVSLMNKDRMKLLGGQVVVKGILVKGKGIQAIYVDSIEKTPAEGTAETKEKK